MTPGVNGALFRGNREYIGYTQKPPPVRQREHMDDCQKKAIGSKWLYLAEVAGEPVVTEDRLPAPLVSAKLGARKLMLALG